jgi:hypothetical protein
MACRRGRSSTEGLRQPARSDLSGLADYQLRDGETGPRIPACRHERAMPGEEIADGGPATPRPAPALQDEIGLAMNSTARPSTAPVELPAWMNPRSNAHAIRANLARQASTRRRLIDPTTCDRDYSMQEREFMLAMQAYKLGYGRPFPTCAEVLDVLKGLGYEKAGDDAGLPALRQESDKTGDSPTTIF